MAIKDFIVKTEAMKTNDDIYKIIREQSKSCFMKRSLAKQLDSSLDMLYNLRINGIEPTDKEDEKYNKIESILYDDGLIEPGPNGAEITAKGLAFMKKGGYVGKWNEEAFKIFLPVFAALVGALLTWLLS